MTVGELALAAYAIVTVGVALWQGNIFAIPYLLLYVGGFGYVGLRGLWDARHGLVVWLRQPFERRHLPQRRGVSAARIIVRGRHS
jgi:hypothetical protein